MFRQMSRKDQIEEMFLGIVQGKPYTGKPIPLNRLSIGGLAYSVEQEIKRKLGEKEETLKDKLNMFRGTALHNHVQYLVKNQGYVSEYRIYYSIPHRWHYMGFESINLVGVIDLLHEAKREIIELKSSTSSDRIEDYHKIQLASYMKMLQEKTGHEYSGIVVKFGGTAIAAEEVTGGDVPDYWATVVRRAIEVADRLDQVMEERDISNLSSDKPDDGGSSGLYGFDNSNHN